MAPRAIGGKGSRVAGRQRLDADPNKEARSRRVVVEDSFKSSSHNPQLPADSDQPPSLFYAPTALVLEIIVMRGTRTSHVLSAVKVFLSCTSRPRSAYSSTNLVGIAGCHVKWSITVASAVRLTWIIDSRIMNFEQIVNLSACRASGLNHVILLVTLY
jgi:hypothetical protein